MAEIHKKPDTLEKLAILSRDSQYDLACSCATSDNEHRYRSKDDKWVYPVVLPNGGVTFLFKTLLSNECVNNCKYCPLRVSKDPQRCSLEPEELVKTFFQYYYARKVTGLFLTSGVSKNPDLVMEKINKTAVILRNRGFRGYMHLKIIPGASDAAIEKAVSLASAVSVNIEAPGEKNFKILCTTKDYYKDIIRPIKLISGITQKGSRYYGVKQTTQFVVGASGETDEDIVGYSWSLYKDLKLSRVYFSAYQRGLGESDLPGEVSRRTNSEILNREHRLYQVDWLIRKYEFKFEEIPFKEDKNLSLDIDPKEMWAMNNLSFFPVNINRADKYELLRVPGLGHITVDRILSFRKYGRKIRSLDELGKAGKRLKKAEKFLDFGK